MAPFDPLIPAVFVFCIVTLIGHVVFVWLSPRPVLFWRVADYAAIALAGLGVVSVSAEVRQRSTAILVQVAQERAERNLDAMARIISSSNALLNCAVPEVRTMTPAKCEWQRESSAALLGLEQEMSPAEGRFSEIEADAIPDGEALFSDTPNPGAVLKATISDYNESLTEIERLRAAADERAVERALSWSAPFLIALGAAIKTTKVSADARRDMGSRCGRP